MFRQVNAEYTHDGGRGSRDDSGSRDGQPASPSPRTPSSARLLNSALSAAVRWKVIDHVPHAFALLKRQEALLTYVTPTLMSVTDIAKALYGDASRGMDILDLNPIEDAVAVPRASVRYYPEA